MTGHTVGAKNNFPLRSSTTYVERLTGSTKMQEVQFRNARTTERMRTTDAYYTPFI